FRACLEAHSRSDSGGGLRAASLPSLRRSSGYASVGRLASLARRSESVSLWVTRRALTGFRFQGCRRELRGACPACALDHCCVIFDDRVCEVSMLVNPRTGPIKGGVVLLPKRFVTDKAVLHSAQGIANTGFAVSVPEMSKQPRTIDDVTLEDIVNGVRAAKEAARELRRTLNGDKKVGVVGAWLAGTIALLASEEEFDATVAVCPFVRLPVADDVKIRQPLEVIRKARAPILAVFGELDSEVPIEDVRALEKA